ncbi:DUF4309 domain-containing protein [Aureibacillus halotolerans]|uniref:Copper amine oxidase-like protein n=1 Tax=Aureibacillus halotolerans TaxID=1508390 RepID=A0A4R6TSY9_9BACI|nr:DUF4309 domain-containing protein [Aureibacillus halotolerans]TDQ33437.1 copper amine oxidase-like protein [Aureibacillus halotolerans]
MKKPLSISVLLACAVLAFSTTAIATDAIQAVIAPLQLVINGDDEELPKDTAILNYNNHTYAPVRFLAEKLGADLDYDGERITLDYQRAAAVWPVNELKVNDDTLSLAKHGQLTGIGVPIGTSKKELIDTLGEPDRTGELNAPYLVYGNTTFYIWRDQENPEHPYVGVIDLVHNLSIPEVKALLGEPDEEDWSDGGYREYLLIYHTGRYNLYFAYNDETSKEGTLLFRDPKI